MNIRSLILRGHRKRTHAIVGPGNFFSSTLALPSTGQNWRVEAGPFESNATVAICLGKILGKIQQARLAIGIEGEDGSFNYRQDAFLQPWKQPNPFMSEPWLASSIAACLKAHGNAYLLKRYSEGGALIGFWPLHPMQVQPRADRTLDGSPNRGTDLVTRYDVTPYGGGAVLAVDPQDIVHFRHGIPDPKNPALALSPLAALVRQICTDNESATYLASLLANMGVPGVILSPKEGTAWPSSDQRERMRELWKTFTRDRRGEPLALPGPLDIRQVTLSPTDLKVIDAKVQASTEICAALGVDPMIVGLPSQSKTYNNMEQAREAFYEDTIFSLLQAIVEGIESCLLQQAGFRLQSNERLAYDRTVYRELEGDIVKQSRIAEQIFRSGASTRGEFRRALGYSDQLDDPRTYFDLQHEPFTSSSPDLPGPKT
jgi:HK97 family phage portal protein